MISANDKYYLLWEVDSWKYKLIFYPGASATISANEIQLPPNFIRKECKVSTGYENDLPIGIPITTALEVVLKLSNIYDNDYADWSKFRKWLIDGTTQIGTTYYNSIYLLSNNGSGDSYTKVEFWGVQDIKPEKELKISADSLEFKITFTGMERACFERIIWDDLNRTFGNYTYQIKADTLKKNHSFPTVIELQYFAKAYYKDKDFNIVQYYTESGGVITWHDVYKDRLHTLGFSGDDGTTINFRAFSDIIGNIYSLAQDNLRKFTRKSDAFVENTNSILTHIQFYKSLVDAEHDKGTGLSLSDLLLMILIFDDGTEVAGYINSNDKNVSIYNFATPWDFFKQLADGLLAKITFSGGASTQNLNITFSKVLETPNVLTNNIILKHDIIGEIKATIGYNAIQTANSTLCGVKGDNDLNEYKKHTAGAENDKNWEGKLPLHNDIVNYLASDTANRRGDNYNHWKTYPTFTNLYYYETNCQGSNGGTVGAIRPVNDICVLDLGSGKTYTWNNNMWELPSQYFYYDEKYVGTDDPTEIRINNAIKSSGWGEKVNDSFQFELQAWLNYRQERSGLGQICSEAAYDLLSQYRQTLVEADIARNKCLPRYIGHKYSLNLEDLLPFVIDLGVASSDAYLTFCETDFTTNKSKCKFFIQGL